jgi:hypothetical protein
VKELAEPEFRRNVDKTEAGIKPEAEGSMKFADEFKA